MNPDTEKNVNEAIDWLQKTGGAIQDFASQQAPEYCREVIAWEIHSSLIWIGVGAVFLLIWIVAWIFAFKWSDDEEASVGAGCTGLLSLAIGVIFCVTNGLDLAKAKSAPRLVIVDHLRSLK